jgi:bacterial leucyl aminopeptidase
MLRKLLPIAVLLLPTWIFAQDVYVTLGEDAYDVIGNRFGSRLTLENKSHGTAMVRIDEAAIPWLSLHMHREFNRCAGFFWHESEQEAFETLESVELMHRTTKARPYNFEINSADSVRQVLPLAQGPKINSFIERLSAFHNRYYTSDTGVEAMHFIRDHWQGLVQGRSDAEVSLFHHAGWPQPSVILTIEGESDEIVIIGGHADSIAGFFNPTRSRAPGADDNASGIATITEIIRVLVEVGHRPQKTLKFMAYAAEEVGLRGSAEIATSFAESNQNVVGVLQLDMTNYVGRTYDMVLISDFTNAEQNSFLGGLITEYLPGVSWGYDRCGYACSDHASWTRAGFPASFPFETTNRERNPNIHTDRDTVERLSRGGVHALNFARLGLAYVLEIDSAQ